MVDLDERDMRIIEILSRNARASYSEIAREIGVSDVAVIKRIRRLEREGVIKGYTVRLDPGKLGYKAVSITGVDVEPESLFTVIKELETRPYVKYLAITSGDHNIIAVIWARDSSEIARIHNEIAGMKGVKRVCPAIILDVIKE